MPPRGPQPRQLQSSFCGGRRGGGPSWRLCVCLALAQLALIVPLVRFISGGGESCNNQAAAASSQQRQTGGSSGGVPQLEEALSRVVGLADSGGDVDSSVEVDARGYRNPAWLDDFVVATMADETRVNLLRANRAWRKGLRTLVATNMTSLPPWLEAEAAAYNERWVYYPDVADTEGTAYWLGDHRAGMAPFLAHREFGNTYKWVLHGDDDTTFFMRGVENLVADIALDHQLPYFVHDWFYERGKNLGPRCMPCGFNDSGWEVGAAPWRAVPGCPCTTRLLCETNPLGVFDGIDCTSPAALALQPKAMGFTSFNGGAGGMLSVGLMEALSFEDMRKCVEELDGRRGGDAHLSLCVWRGGYGMTGLPRSFYTAEPQPRRLFARWGPVRLTKDMFDAVVAGACAVSGKKETEEDRMRCREREGFLDHMVSTHAGARTFKNMVHAGLVMKAAVSVYLDYTEDRAAHNWQ